MEEKFKLLNDELERIGLTKDDFWLLSVWKNNGGTGQAEYKAHLAVKFMSAGYKERISPNGFINFTHPEKKFEFTLN